MSVELPRPATPESRIAIFSHLIPALQPGRSFFAHITFKQLDERHTPGAQIVIVQTLCSFELDSSNELLCFFKRVESPGFRLPAFVAHANQNIVLTLLNLRFEPLSG